jgi:DNA repair exonuclease SbcCD nuclease subunit
VKILHFADVHLGRPFVGVTREAAQRRRGELHDAFSRCLALAEAHEVDLVTIGGDLWEEEHVTADTRDSVVYELERLNRPVLAIAGNHDPLIPGGTYARVTWPENVYLVRSSEPELHEFGDVAIWGVSWTGGELSGAFWSSFRVPSDGRTHLLLLHGTSGPLGQLADDQAFTFQPADVQAAGFAYCLAGHVHIASDDGTIVYPSSPEPLRWNETDRHCVALVSVVDGTVGVELVDVNERIVETRKIDCAGCSSSSELGDRLRAALTDTDSSRRYVRIYLVGEIGPDCLVDVPRLRNDHEHRYAGLLLEDRTEPALDVNARAERRGLDGIFTRRMHALLAKAESDDERRTLRRALEAGLRAIDGRDKVLHVD